MRPSLRLCRRRLVELWKEHRLSRLERSGQVHLSPSTYSDRRVLIVGPADTVGRELENLAGYEFDVVARLNRALSGETTRSGRAARTDVLFHNLNERGPRGAGRLDIPALRKQRVGVVLYPHAMGGQTNSRFFRASSRFRRQNDVTLLMPPRAFYEQLFKDLDCHYPTTGTVAIAYFLEAAAKSLNIVGFTFFRTGYDSTYNAEVKTGEDARRWVVASDLHDPDLERDIIRQRILEARKRGLHVELGEGTAEALGLPQVE